MNVFHKPPSYGRSFFRVGVLWPSTGRGKGSAGCANLTLLCRLYFQPLGLLQGWHLHPKSASYVGLWMVSLISPPASESWFHHLLNYRSKCSSPGQGTPAHSPFPPYPKIPCSPTGSCYSTQKPERALSSKVNTTFFPKTFASGSSNTRK